MSILLYPPRDASVALVGLSCHRAPVGEVMKRTPRTSEQTYDGVGVQPHTFFYFYRSALKNTGQLFVKLLLSSLKGYNLYRKLY